MQQNLKHPEAIDRDRLGFPNKLSLASAVGSLLGPPLGEESA